MSSILAPLAPTPPGFTPPVTRRAFLGGLASASGLVLLHPFAARAASNQAHLRIMETTDIHVHVYPYDYYGDKPNETLGLSRTASIIDAIRAEATNSILLDNGDFLQGNMLKETEWKDLPVLSAAAPFKAGGRGGPDYYTDVPAGDIAIKNVADLYLYPNTVQAVAISGAQVKDWLEMSAGMFNSLKPGGKDQPLLAADFPSYNFDVIDGVTYEIDLSQPTRFDTDGKLVNPDANRITDLMFSGKPIDPSARFVVATNNYRAGGGGKFPEIGSDKVIFAAPDTNRDVIVRFIHEQGTINPAADANWRFKPLPGTTAVFDTGPKARPLLGEIKTARIEDAGDGAEGFARFRLVL